ncbi:hypothetical protein F4X86_03770 [Candidatus Saccharibacteria bacterium]|nr:hypothetical protein [Candidatus Saccharibacteria bacterium]
MKNRSPKTIPDSEFLRPAKVISGRRINLLGIILALAVAATYVFIAPVVQALEQSDTRITNFWHTAGDNQALFEVQVKQGLIFYRAEYYASESVLSACPEDVDLYGPNQGYTRDLEGLNHFYKQEGDWRIWGYKTDTNLTSADRSICFGVVAESGSSYNFHGPYALGESVDAPQQSEPGPDSSATVQANPDQTDPSAADQVDSAEAGSSSQADTTEASYAGLNAGGTSESTCADATNPDDCEARQTINSVLNLMAILIMPIVSIMIIIGGIQYSMAQNNSDAINAARARIYKAILALICFIALWSFLKWLIPGGLE